MTRKLYDENSFLKEFNAEVLECEEYNKNWAVILDKTAFFPEGGGQPSDIGYIDNATVLDVQISDEKIYHITDKPLAVGSTVTGTIDFDRRFDFMQQHSGEHIISGVANRLFGCENVGFHLSEDIVTLDFDKPLSREQIEKLEKEVNKKVFSNLKFNCYYPDKETLKALNYRSKKELNGAIRIVEIEDTDLCACCAPHVSFSGEIGIIKLLGSEALRGGVRIEIKCGARALADYKEKYENVSRISALLCSKQNETAKAVERLINENKDLGYKLSTLKKQIIEEKVKAFDNTNEVTAIFENGLDIKELQLFADMLYKKLGGIKAVFSGEDGTYSFAICGDREKLDSFFADFKNTFTVRGGGRNGMVQGTVTAEYKALKEYFKI